MKSAIWFPTYISCISISTGFDQLCCAKCKCGWKSPEVSTQELWPQIYKHLETAWPSTFFFNEFRHLLQAKINEV